MKINQLLKQRPTISFEIFPPKKDGDLESIYATIEALKDLNPDFISVTYGAGGSTTRNSVQIASAVKNKYGIDVVAHLSCIDSSKETVRNVLTELKENGIENILALRGDYPKDYDPETAPHEFAHASDLVEFINDEYPDTFCISGACYPEVHQQASSFQEDLENLKKKVDAGATYLVTQLFYGNEYYYRLVREAKKIGIDVPILAGIMPCTSAKQLIRNVKMSGGNIPYELMAMVDRFEGNPKAMKEVGLNYAVYQIMDLIANGVEGIHIYTMNKPELVKEIVVRTEHLMKAYLYD